MSLITTEEARTYLRVDSGMDDVLIDSLGVSLGVLLAFLLVRRAACRAEGHTAA